MNEALIRLYKQLRPYQKEGTQFLFERKSALLADEMGLGITIQCPMAINFLFNQKELMITNNIANVTFF